MKYIIGVDVDGILRDFSGDLLNIIKKEYPQYIKYDIDVIDEWDMERCFDASKEDIQQIYWHEYCDEIMGNGTPFQENVDQIKHHIENDEHTYICVTSQKKHARHYTLKWLGQQGINFNSVFFRKGKEKWLVECDYLIDDSPENWLHWKNGRGSDENFILIDTPHNQKVKSKHRVKSISEAIEVINEN